MSSLFYQITYTAFSLMQIGRQLILHREKIESYNVTHTSMNLDIKENVNLALLK